MTDNFPSARSQPTNHVYTRLCDPSSRQFIDLTGRFPVRSLHGAEYILLFFVEDANYIHVEPVPSRHATAVAKAYRTGHTWFRSHGVTPTYLQLDNETSTHLQSFCAQEDIQMQYCPPENHRANKAERSIRTFKNHLVSILSAADPDFPLEIWDLLLAQAELTANMLRGSNLNPTISAWEQLNGPYDFNAHPLAPPGIIKVLAFESPIARESWAPHGRAGFYVGPASQHYRCYRVFIPETKRVRVVDTLSWHPSRLLLPGTSPIDDLSAATRDLAMPSAAVLLSSTPYSTNANH